MPNWIQLLNIGSLTLAAVCYIFWFFFFQERTIDRGKFWLRGKCYKVRQISPSDWLDGDHSLGIFKGKKVQTMYEKTLAAASGAKKNQPTDAEKKRFADQCKKIISECVLSVNSKPLTLKDMVYLGANPDIAHQLTQKIISLSLKKFTYGQELHTDVLLYYSIMAEKFGVAPITLLFPEGGYTEYEAFCFNSACFNRYMEQQK